MTGRVGLCLFLVACSSKSSDQIDTQDINADMHVEVDADPTHPTTRFYTFFQRGEPGDFVDVTLADSDILTVKTDKDASIQLTRDGTEYTTDPLKAADRTDATFLFTRQKGVSATSTVHLLPPAAISTPAQGASIPYASGKVDLAWTKTDGAFVSFFVYPCGSVSTATGDDPVDDTGAATLAMSKLLASAPTSPTCVTIRLDRQMEGKVDPALRSSSTLFAWRYDHLDVTITP